MEYCCYCGRQLIWPLIRTNEHIIPKSHGGSDHPKNKRPCCKRCNQFRSNKPLAEWKSEIKFLVNRGYDHMTFKIEDLKIILINIDYIEQAVITATPDMFK